MRILHIGSGYPPIAGGGLTRYAMDLMAVQAAAGHDVCYLCAGDYDLAFRPRLRRWRLGAVLVFELANPRVENIHMGRQAHPEREISEPAAERLTAQVISEVRPEVAHLHNLLGWPISLLNVLHARGVPAIFTFQNHHALCPTTRLYDEVADEVCTDFAEGRRCARCNAARIPARQFRNLRRFRADRLIRAAPRLFGAVRRLKRLLVRGREQASPSCIKNVAQLPDAGKASETFRRRREAFVAALNQGVLTVGMSRRVSALLVGYGVRPDLVRTLQLVLRDFGDIQRRPPRTPELPVRFGLLNKLTHLKGADVLRESFAGLDPRQVRLLIFGLQSEAGMAAVRPLVESGVAELRGPYERARMNDVLGGIDVGLVPSIWEEPYGYVGVEFLAAGIPVLGSRIGGIPDYVEDGVNGFLLPPRDAAAWRAKLARLAAEPEEVARLAAGITPVKTMSEHLAEIERLYAEAAGLSKNRGT